MVVWLFVCLFVCLLACLVGWLVGLLLVVVCCCLGFVVFGWLLLAFVVEPPAQTTPCGPGHKGVLGELKPRMLLLVVVVG